MSQQEEEGPGRVALTDPRQRVGDAHQVQGVLGRGAMGTVHRALDPRLNREVALKVLDPERAKEPMTWRRFHNEVQITAQLDHPSIVPVYRFEKTKDGNFAYSMKLVKGRTLSEFIEEIRRFYDQKKEPDADHALPARLELFAQLCDALAYAHSRGVIHRDLKPPNIMVGDFHEVRVMDWGVARLIDDPRGRGTTTDDPPQDMTQVGMAVGTVPYMSPEQAQGRNPELDPRSDQYALGLILYELVYLRRAVKGLSVSSMLQKAARGRKSKKTHYRPGTWVPPQLEAIIDKATAPDRDQRYPDVRALAEDVRRLLRDEEVSALPEGPMQKAQRFVSRHRKATVVGGVVLILLVFLVGAVTTSGGLALLIVQGQLAQEREAQLGEAMAAISERARGMDVELQRYHALAHGIGTAAELALQRDPEPAVVHLPEDFQDPDRAPSDLVDSPIYGVPVSLGSPDFAVAPGASPQVAERQLQQLAGLHPALLRVLVESANAVGADLEAARQMVAIDGVPLVWAYVATEEGVIVAMPGTGGYPDGYDPREQPWYAGTLASREPHWDAGADEGGMGLLVTASMPIFDLQGDPVGVAAVDVSAQHLVERFLQAPEGARTEAFLLDDHGDIVARSSWADRADALEEPETFPHRELEAAIGARPTTGYYELATPQGTMAATWASLPAIGWTYLVMGPPDEVLEMR